jgi:hypothetical protein
VGYTLHTARTSCSEIAAAIARHDYFRRSPSRVGGRGGHKEWHHFCVLGDQVELLANFSLSDDVRPGARRGVELARLTVLACDGAWDGDVENFAAEEVFVRPGRIDVMFGQNALRFEDGSYHLDLALRDRALTAEVELRPLTLPSPAPNIPLPDGPPLHWVIVPRLSASGRVSIGGRTHRLDGALAYHDHNWGHFLWGHGFSWVWGFSLPVDTHAPWSLVFVRLATRARSRALAQGLFLWKAQHQYRLFRDHDVQIALGLELLRPERVFKIPAVMGLLHPETPTDVPRQVEMQARGDDDWMHWVFEARDLAQVLVPSETDFGVTVINEVSGRMRLRGVIGGEEVDVDGRAVCEFLAN